MTGAGRPMVGPAPARFPSMGSALAPFRDGLLVMAFAMALLSGATAAAEQDAHTADSFYANFSLTPLRDQDARSFDPWRLRGKVVLVNFIYTGCSSVCPQQTRALVGLQRRLPPDLSRHVHLLSISLDPLGDPPEALRRYARTVGADLSNWTFVVGRPQDSQQLTSRLRLLDPTRPGAIVADHSTSVWLLGVDGRVMQRYAGNPPDIDRLQRELSQLVDMQGGIALKQH